MTEPGTDILRYADAAMYDAQPILHEEGTRVTPRVFLLNATPDPLGTCAADMRMYRGDPVYSLDEITDEQRRWAWEELSKTHLNTPLEGVNLKFMIEAVTRSFTHQMVRQRVGAYYVQESLRFAVKKGIAQECALPPSIISHDDAVDQAGAQHPPDGSRASFIWHRTINQIQHAYGELIALGIPAEDARGLLPHCVTTRIIYHTNLRALFEHAGNRLCTQAQFEWRAVFMGMMQAIKGYHSPHIPVQINEFSDGWQWELIAQPRSHTFTPICYRLGKCAFMSELDRGCTIRDRVQTFAEHGVPSNRWQGDIVGHSGVKYVTAGDDLIPGIEPEEWMADPSAGITTESNRPT